MTLIVVGMAGLFAMALPAVGRSVHIGGAHGGHPLPASHATAHGPGALPGRGGWLGETVGFFLSPRAIFSLLALYGAAGNAFVRAGHLTPPLAAVAAVVPALLVERLVVAPLWNLMFRYQAIPSSPLHQLLLGEAKAVTPFKNGRGVVAVERDGRLVQFMARLPPAQAMMSVRVGTLLRIDEVDGARECLLVTFPAPTGGRSSDEAPRAGAGAREAAPPGTGDSPR